MHSKYVDTRINGKMRFHQESYDFSFDSLDCTDECVLQMTTERCSWPVKVTSSVCDPITKLEVEKFHSTFSRD